MHYRSWQIWLCVMAMAGDGLGRSADWSKFAQKPDEWHRSEEGRRIAANILSHQSVEGSWPKNIDTAAQPYTSDLAKLQGTFDNGATTGELRFLARAWRATNDLQYEKAFLKGFDHILKAQYSTGGWPQFYPPSRQYHRHITFNDDAMVRLIEFLREVAESTRYEFVDSGRRRAARESFDRGIQCILKCQIKSGGKLTAWCAQHDEKDLSPRPGRSYELVSLSGSESVGIVKLLMSLEHPSPEVIQSVQAAVAWFETARLTGIRIVQTPDPAAPKGFDKAVVSDPNGRPMWARFYEIGSNKPIFSGRDGVAKANLADIGYERRNGYSWLGYWPEEMLAKDYPAWRKRVLPD